VTPEFCRDVIDQVGAIQQELKTRIGINFALLGDEIYLRAGRAIPTTSHYGDYPQIEDGVGMVRSFIKEFAKLRKRIERESGATLKHRSGTILTGTLFAPVLQKLVHKLNEQTGSRLVVEPVENGYFGGDVSVAGLLTGQDLLSARNRVKGEFVLIPRQMLKSDEEIMLDGMKLNDVSEALGVPVHAINLEQFGSLLLQKN
jgi:NifB/MoaA-like Fe-S oxidoreductase